MAKLFTPGPLNTSETVKQAMLRDVGSRDAEFIECIRYVREELVKLAGGLVGKHVCVPLQGAGSFAIQAVLDNAIGRSRGKSNGAHYALVAVVHCETSTGIVNPIHQIAALVAKHTTSLLLVDAMSSLGALPVNMEDDVIHFVVSSANKCLQGVPGFAYVIADEDSLLDCRGNCTSWAFDLPAQLNGWGRHSGLKTNGQFRCTPPTHAMLAFRQALEEFHEETFEGRVERYKNNNRIIREGMAKLGFRATDEHLPDETRGYIITPFHYPDDERFEFGTFYKKLSERQQVIYPGKTVNADTFRLGNIGHLDAFDCVNLLAAVQQVLLDMHVAVPVAAPRPL